MAEILVVDDEEDICSAFEQFLTGLGHRPLIASNAGDALAIVAESHPDLIFLDLRMPGMDGLDALRAIHDVDPDAYVVIMTAYGTSQTSIDSMRLGAYDYLRKPLDLDVVKPVIEKALQAKALSRESEATTHDEWKDYALVNLVGQSTRMQDVYRRIGLLTTNDVPVLVSGERGVGRELVARTIHFNSRRRDKPFMSVDCAMLPEPILEEKLSGATSLSGHVGESRVGTLFLRNVEALSPGLQARLLDLLDSGGLAVTPSSHDVRVIAATENALAERVQQGHFSEVLADRLSVISIELPPLRERPEDIPDLVAFFLERYSAEFGKTIRGVDDRVMQLLLEYPWPRNVAELRNVLQRGHVLARADVITPDDLGDSLQDRTLPGRAQVQSALEVAVRRSLQQRLGDPEASADESPFYDLVGEVEALLIREALAQTGGNQLKAAELLNLNRTTLRKKIQLHGL